MIYLKKPMKKLARPVITIGLGLVLAVFSPALTYSAPFTMQGNLGAATFFLQPTTTPQPQNVSEIGSTDGIAALGIIISLIVIVPILLRRKSWAQFQ
jgi:hypothetical protein